MKIEHNDQVGVLGGQSVGHGHGGAALGDVLERGLDLLLGVGVEGRGGL